jgi:polyisoprenoid-binding protein YceI
MQITQLPPCFNSTLGYQQNTNKMGNKKFKIVPAKSNIDWTGRKVTGAHNGTIGIKEGTLVFNDDELTSGNFKIDTTSIKILDITDPATKNQFAGHLASDDFFSSEKYPEAIFTISGAERNGKNEYIITGDLTIKGTTHPVVFNAQLRVQDDTLTALGKITVDRTLYGMKFRSGNFFKNLGDTLIYNDFELNVSITAQAVAEPVLAQTSGIN